MGVGFVLAFCAPQASKAPLSLLRGEARAALPECLPRHLLPPARLALPLRLCSGVTFLPLAPFLS